MRILLPLLLALLIATGGYAVGRFTAGIVVAVGVGVAVAVALNRKQPPPFNPD